MSSKTVLISAAFVLLALVASAESSRILVFYPKAIKSHTLVFEGISIALADAGHEVTVVSPSEFRNSMPNLKQVVLTGLKKKYNKANKNSTLGRSTMSPTTVMGLISKSAPGPLTEALLHPNMRKIMATSSFDLVIFEQFCTEALVGLGQHFGAPLIVVSTYGVSQQINDLVGNPSSLSHVRHSFAYYPPTMHLISRLTNVVLDTYEKMWLQYVNIPNQRNIFETVFPNARVSFDAARHNVSLVFENTHFTINGPRPMVPNMIEIAGVHFDRKIKPLPEVNINEFICLINNIL